MSNNRVSKADRLKGMRLTESMGSQGVPPSFKTARRKRARFRALNSLNPEALLLLAQRRATSHSIRHLISSETYVAPPFSTFISDIIDDIVKGRYRK